MSPALESILKRLFICLCIATCTISARSQGIRNLVVVEIATATFCAPCVSTALGADDLAANNHSVAILEHHFNDPYATPETQARLDFYNIMQLSTSVWDGHDTIIVNNADTSVYPEFLPLYNQQIAAPTPFNLSMSKTDNGNGNFEVDVTVEQVGAYSGGFLVLHLAVTESHIPESWEGLNSLEFVTRDFIPTEAGTAITIQPNSQVMQSYNFSLDSSWVQNNCEVVAFLQNYVTKEIFNGAKLSLDPNPVGRLEPRASGLSIFPNPNKGLFKMEIPDFQGEAAYSIFQTNGQVAAEGLILKSSTEMDLRELPSGIYFIKIETVEKVYMDKFLLR